MTTPTGHQVSKCTDRRQLRRWKIAAIERHDVVVASVITLQLAMMKGVRRHG